MTGQTDNPDQRRPVAVVTGGTRGIGFGCATALAQAGYDLVINGMRPADQVSSALDNLRSGGAEVVYARGDVGTEEGRREILDLTRSVFGRLNVLVNNAGVAPAERLDILETTGASFERLIAINCQGPFFLTQAAARWMIEQKQTDETFEGCIINVNSISASVVSVNRAEYCVSKAALAMVTKCFAARLGEFGLGVYEVRPGVTRTDMTSGVVEKYDRLIRNGLCVTPRWGHPEDTGRVVAALASGAFAYSTGQVIMVDGGLTLPRL